MAGIVDEATLYCTLVMCFLKRTHDSDPTPTIVSPIPIPTEWEPLVPPGGDFR